MRNLLLRVLLHPTPSGHVRADPDFAKFHSFRRERAPALQIVVSCARRSSVLCLHEKSLPLEGKVSNIARRMRCSHRGWRYILYKRYKKRMLRILHLTTRLRREPPLKGKPLKHPLHCALEYRFVKAFIHFPFSIFNFPFNRRP